MDFDKVLEQRHSVRSYTNKVPDLKDIIRIMNAGRLGPFAGNICTVRFILVTDKSTKEKLAEAAHEQKFIAKAPYLIVVYSLLDRIAGAYGSRGEIYARQQAGAVIENMLLKTTDLGLASCWVGAFDEQKVESAIQVPRSETKSVKIEAILPIGYKEGKKKVERKKPDVHEIAFMEYYGKKR